MKTVILIKGAKRSGKDTTADIMLRLMQCYNATRLSFAEPMKEILADTFCVSRDYLESAKNEPEAYPSSIPKIYGIEETSDMRQILQRFGTEAMKKQFGDDVWVELLYNKIHSDITIVSDWRFESELAYLKSKDDIKVITVEVVRVGQINNDTHVSERDLDDVSCDFKLENITGELDVLECQIDDMISCIPKQKNMMEYFDYFKCGKLC